MNRSGDSTKHTLPRQGHPWLRAILLGSIILVCGMFIGGGITLYVATQRVMDAVQNPEKVPARVVARMQRNLDLTDEQAATLEGIIERHQNNLLAIRAEVQPRVKAELGTLQQEVEEILTPEQAERFRERLETLRSRLLLTNEGVPVP